MKVEKAVREFKYNGMVLADPDASQTIEEVKAFYANIYPELNNAEIETETKGAKTVHEFRKAVGTKGVTSRLKAGHLPHHGSPGADMINRERRRQVMEEGWTPQHDDEHADHSLALAACAYAAPVPLYREILDSAGVRFVECWPHSWDARFDKRKWLSNSKPASVDEMAATTYMRNLVKAGALIAAEIDRLLRAEANRGKTKN